MSDDDDTDETDEDSDSQNEVSFSIRIVDGEGEGIEGLTVTVRSTYGSWGAVGNPEEAETDADGWAEFSIHAPFRKLMDRGIDIEISVKDTVLAEKVWVEEGDTFSYAIDEDDL